MLNSEHVIIALVAQGLEHAIADRRVDRSNRSQSFFSLFYFYFYFILSSPNNSLQ